MSSGSVSDQIKKDFREYGFSAVLSKPFKKDDLKKILNKVIPGGMRIMDWTVSTVINNEITKC